VWSLSSLLKINPFFWGPGDTCNKNAIGKNKNFLFNIIWIGETMAGVLK
jgi:hypothetical protein